MSPSPRDLRGATHVHVFRKLPLWLYWPIGALLLWAGLALASSLMDDPADVARADLLRQAPLWVLVVVPLGEALVWTVAFVEVGACFRAPVIGAAIGVAAYSVLLHASFGIWGIVVSAWIGVIVNGCYVLMRDRSRVAAVANALALRWSFIAYAYFSVGGQA
jgi:hypothetical protein